MDSIRNRIKGITDAVGELRYFKRRSVGEIKISEGDYNFPQRFDREAHDFRTFKRDETWGGKDRHYWFLASERIPGQIDGYPVRVLLNTGATDIWNTDNPQITVYVDGVPAGTMDMNHQEVIPGGSDPLKTHELAFYAYSGTPSKTNFFHLDYYGYREEAAELYYDMKVLWEAVDLLPEDHLERIDGLKLLNECANLLDLRKPGSEDCFRSMKEASELLNRRYYQGRRANPVTVHSVGHTHIDVAWKWPLRQTRQKAVRSFTTVLSLMDRYPEYKFMSSQPQLYQFVKEEAPEVYERVKARVREGRWEAEGAMWLEPDCNLSSGESLIRHILCGRRFFEEELGAPANEVLWLPDVFGYSAALPQIMKKSGLSYFMTTKLGWNEYNQFPHDTFLWRGIDGSEVLTYLITTRDYEGPGEKKKKSPFSTTYNGRQNASQIMGTWQRYQDKDVSRDVLTCYGYGDGGGGPTEEMLEESRRLEDSPGECPAVRQTHVKEFFHILEENMDRSRLAVWCGELYLECHRGTYTSMAKNKRYNRKCEFLNGQAESFSVLAGLLNGSFPYPKEKLEKSWKLLLLNQFHDILPGSSIKEVYEDSELQYEEILANDGELIEKAQNSILTSLGYGEAGGDRDRLAVFNPLSFPRTGIAELRENPEEAPVRGLLSQKTEDGAVLYLVENAAPLGVSMAGAAEQDRVFRAVELRGDGRPERIQTAFYELVFDEHGEISSLVDLREERELIKAGETGNRLTVWEDRPMEFDAWNIDRSYMEKSWPVQDLEKLEITENGPVRGCVRIRRRFLDSTVEQDLLFYGHTARIDFKTRVWWNEHQLLLKVRFPLDIFATEADYEIQFGSVRRPTHGNTSWDQARFEVCAHKWADLSEPGYGVALLNDCKYGYDIHDSVMSLTLIKSGIFPNPEADQGFHEFTYALFMHRGDHREGGVIREAYDLNCPLTGIRVSGEAKREFSLLNIREENILADTVKMAEDGSGIIVRLYEAYGKRTKAHIRLSELISPDAVECDCMEKELTGGEYRMTEEENLLEFTVKPYEIKTIKIKRKQEGEKEYV